MNNLNNNQLTGRAFAYQTIQGQPDQRSSGSSIPSNVVNVTQYRNFANNSEAQSYINSLLNSNGAYTATISHAYRFPGSPADITLPPGGTQSRAPVPNSHFSSSSRDLGQRVNLCGPTIQAPNTSDTLMLVGTVVVPDRQPHLSFGGSQNAAGNGGNFAPPMTPVARRPSMSSSGSSYSCFGNSTPGSPREELVCNNGLCPVCGSVHTPNSGAISSASSDYGSESSYYRSSDSGYQSSSGASSTGLTTGRLCRNCNSYAPRNPDIFPEGYCLYCAEY